MAKLYLYQHLTYEFVAVATALRFELILLGLHHYTMPVEEKMNIRFLSFY